MLKKIFICLLIFTTISVTSQTRQEKEIKNTFWGASDTEKDNVTIPEKWNNESAVILYQEYFHDYHKFGKNVRYTRSIRMRVNFLDKAAIEDYSEFLFEQNLRVRRGFWGNRETKFSGVKLIKPNGVEREL